MTPRENKRERDKTKLVSFIRDRNENLLYDQSSLPTDTTYRIVLYYGRGKGWKDKYTNMLIYNLIKEERLLYKYGHYYTRNKRKYL